MKKSLKNILVGFMKLILIFISIKRKKKVDRNELECILFRTDVYLTEHFLAIEIDEQNHESRELIFEKEKTRGIKINLVVNLLELIHVMQKRVMMQVMKLVEYKYLSVNLKKKK